MTEHPDKKIHEISDGAGYMRVTEHDGSNSPDIPPSLAVRIGFHGENDHDEVVLFKEEARFLFSVLRGWLG